MKRDVKLKSGFRTMKPKNPTEAQLYDVLESEGWTVAKSGYPDFFCVRDGKIMCVEVKPKSTHGLKTNQRMIMEYLSSYGVPCFKWTPDGGFEEIKAKKE